MTADAPRWLEPAPDDIIEAARKLPDGQPSDQTREAVRTSLLIAAKVEADAPPVRAASRLRYAPWAAAALAAGVALWLGLRAGGGAGDERADERGERPAERVATVHASAAADFSHTSVVKADGTTDEIVRLEGGRVSVEVEALDDTERFRVITGDAEVEVRGTSFDVTVEDDRLVGVEVRSGRAEVRLLDRAPMLLGAGERWSLGDEKRASADVDSSTPSAAVATGSAEDERDVPSTSSPAARPSTPSTAARPSTPSAAIAAESAQDDPSTPPAAVAADSAADERVQDERDAVVPTDGERSFDAGWTALRGGNYGTAAFHFQLALDLEPEGPLAEDARYWRAIALARAGKSGDARSAMREFLDHHGRSRRAGEVAVMLGRLLVEAGDAEAARALFESAKDHRNPDVREAARAGLTALDSDG